MINTIHGFQMNHKKPPNSPDVIMLYQERDSVELAIPQIMELDLKFKAYQLDTIKLHDIAEMEPKIVLLSSNNVKNTIRFYIDYLEEYGQDIAPHSAILLINNRETSCAYLACESGLFDNYAIINPLNEPFRLKLVLLQELKIIQQNEKSSLLKLASDGEEELASCIEHGVALKKSFLHEVSKCEASLLAATTETIEDDEARAILQNLVGITLEEMNENVTAQIQGILEQLVDLKTSSQTLKQNIEKHHKPTSKTTLDIDAKALLSHEESYDEPAQTTSYKILIAEPSDSFSHLFKEVFSGTAFKYLLVEDGQEALSQITAFNPDVVLLSYDLPSLNGIDVTKIIREKGNKVPVIAYTHNHDKIMIQHWIPLGLHSNIIKPSNKNTLLKGIDNAINNPTYILPPKSTTIDDIQWLDEYSVGNNDVDDRHKMLFGMISDFFCQKGKQATIAYLYDLTSYIDLDFEAEEVLLRQINYPFTDDHVKKHNELREKLRLMSEKLENYNEVVHHKIAVFIYNWLASHILTDDMKYKEYALSIEEESFSKPS